METNCAGCAGCCLDWRPLGGAPDHERSGRYRPLDDEYNLVPLTSDEVRTFLRAGLGDALSPRPFVVTDTTDGADDSRDTTNDRDRTDGRDTADDRDATDDDRDRTDDRDTPETVEIDGHALVAWEGRPLFAVGLRSVPKPVAPFGRTEPVWLDACVFLDPATLQCRIHESDEYPRACGAYPGHNLAFDAETECERVRAHDTTERLVDDDPPENLPPRPFGPQALGATIFAHPSPDDLAGRIDRVARGEPTDDDRAAFVACAAACAPGSLAVDPDRRAHAERRLREADSWITAARADWLAAASDPGTSADTPPDPDSVETDRGAPPTPGWDAV